MLNTELKIGGRVKDNDNFCSIYWEGVSCYEVTAVELSKYAEPYEDMVINVESERMPADIIIGKVKSSAMNASKTAYTVELNIAADMQCLSDLLVVENRDQNELNRLMESVEK